MQNEFKGLSEKEVLINKKKFGENRISSGKQFHFLYVLRDVVSEPIFIVLVITSIIYFILGEFIEGIIMLIALGFVSGISLFQENRSRNAVNALNKLASPMAKVFREGVLSKIPAEEVVIDDIILVEDGDLVPVDAIILKSNDFSVSESILSGESLAVHKGAKDKDNHIYLGTHVVSGSCTARTTSIGKSTAFGKISESLKEIGNSKTPLQIQIKRFIRSMVTAGVIAFFIVWIANYYISKDILQGLLRGLTLAMSILPEEIPVAFSTFMALGAYHLYKKKVIARSPYTVETLGAATVICVDKTGTITENRMQVAVIYDHVRNEQTDYTNTKGSFNEVLNYALWASEVQAFDAMEISIHTLYEELAPEDMRKKYTMIREYPLGGIPPFMTHVFSDHSGNHIIAAKGSIEGILKQCSLSEDEKKNIIAKSSELGKKGYRLLGVAKSDMNPDKLPDSQEDIHFDFLGIISFYDPPKKNMPDILQAFYSAGIEVKIITGDHAETAEAIAGQIGFTRGAATLSGQQILKMQETELRKAVRESHLFTRMFPEAKLKVIEALKANGEVVAMTGDGVNDAPALKAAHIGIAMGQRGSEVAKSSASLILMDDDLVHMTEAIAIGRRIYENLKKAIRYIISIHIPIILIVTLPLILLWSFLDIFSPIHVIVLELIMGPTCSIIYENEPMEANYMKKKPRKMTSTFFSLKELSLSIVQGLVLTIACLGIGHHYLSNGESEEIVRTVIYSTLIFGNLFLTLANRSFYYSIFTTLRYKNRLIPLILSISLIILFLSIYFEPLQRIFRFAALNVSDLLWCFVLAFIGVMWVEVYKWIKRMSKDDSSLSMKEAVHFNS